MCKLVTRGTLNSIESYCRNEGCSIVLLFLQLNDYNKSNVTTKCLCCIQVFQQLVVLLSTDIVVCKPASFPRLVSVLCEDLPCLMDLYKSNRGKKTSKHRKDNLNNFLLPNFLWILEKLHPTCSGPRDQDALTSAQILKANICKSW